MADFIDFFYIGEAEAGFGAVLDAYAAAKERRLGRTGFLRSIAGMRGVYVPRFYDVKYNADGTQAYCKPNDGAAPAEVIKAVAPVLDDMFTPDKQVLPNIESVHDRAALEVFRGCSRGCRFCQAGYVYRPCREKTPEKLISVANALLCGTGYDEISLLSLSTGDYSRFPELAEGALNLARGRNVSLSLPSLRVDAFSLELMEKIAGARRSGLTFAPEAGSQRLRDIINKNLSEDDILNGCRLAFVGGWKRVKLYCMLGLPYETDEDVEALAELSHKVVDVYRKTTGSKNLSVNLSASCFVPKPHTPFQFTAQAGLDELREKQRLLKRSIRRKQVQFSYHNADTSVTEGALSRGDRKVGKAIYEAFLLGARFDGWSEHFNYELWERAFAQAGLDMRFYTGRERPVDETLPWDHIRTGADKTYLAAELERARQGLTTPDCRDVCTACGASVLVEGMKRGVCHE